MNYTVDYVDEPLKARLIKESKINRFSDKKPGYKTIENGVVLPVKGCGWRAGGGIISDDGYEDGSACYTYVRNFGVPYEYDKSAAEFKDETVIYAGMFSKIWGHCISDNLSHLWFFKSEYYGKYKACNIIYTAPEGELSDNFAELLRLADIPADKFIRVTAPTKFSRIILPDRSFFTVNAGEYVEGEMHFADDADMYVTREYIDMIKSAADKISASADDKYDKVYFSRARFSKSDVGAEKLDKFFAEQGYTVVYPEKHTLAEQIAILKRCNHFAATEGSVSHNSIFLKDNCEAVIITRGMCFTPHTFALNAVNNLKAVFISGTLSILTKSDWKNSGPHFYYISDELVKYFGAERLYGKRLFWKKNFGDFKKYVKLYSRLSCREQRVCDAYYYKRAGACLDRYYATRERTFPYFFKHPRYIVSQIKNIFIRPGRGKK